MRALGRLVPVIVVGNDAHDAAMLVDDAQGEVVYPLPIVNGVSARVPAANLGDLSARTLVVADYPLHVQSAAYGDGLASAYPKEVGAPALWGKGLTGAGVTVALVDTGIADVPDLDGRVVAEANFTKEATFTDSYGHGTFQAGIIAGDGDASDGAYVGIAPEASLLSVKVAGASGDTNLGQVLAGLQLVDWSAKKFNVRVALLALSSDSPLPPDIDPLSFALRQMWAHGILVVVPAGNEGPTGSVTSPGEDPVLLTAGSVDDHATPDVSDDTVSDFTGRGPTRWGDDKPDIAAPGEHLVSLRAPGSTVDKANSSARVGDAYFKGSGTSMSAAVTAGAGALIAQAQPKAGPDEIKAMLMGSAVPVVDAPEAIGAGVIDAATAASLDPKDMKDLPKAPDVDKASPPFSPKGLDVDWYGKGPMRWMPKRFLARTWNGRTWNARSWNARIWTDAEWDARSWAGAQWAAGIWDARSWNARSWAARSWAARSWAARSWAARTWAARSWAARSWAARTWAARTWSSDMWDGDEWSARTWSARTWSARTWSARSWSMDAWG